MARLFINTPIKRSAVGPNQSTAVKLSLKLSFLALLPALLIGCDQAPETALSPNLSGQQTLETTEDSSAAESLWRYQNTRLGDPKGDEEIYAKPASDDPLIKPIHRRSAHSTAMLDATQINQEPAPRDVTLAIKTDPTHGRYLTLSDADQRFDCQPSCELIARFDTGESQIFEFESTQQSQLFLLKDTQAKRLVDKIKTAKTLQLSIPVLNQDPADVRYTFDVRGLDLGKIAL